METKKDMYITAAFMMEMSCYTELAGFIFDILIILALIRLRNKAKHL